MRIEVVAIQARMISCLPNLERKLATLRHVDLQYEIMLY